MTDDRLWAPWRLDYVRSGSTGASAPSSPDSPPEPSAWRDGADRGCFLCRAAAQFEDDPSADRQHHVVERGPHSLIVLNRFPYNNGHALVAPLRHVGQLDELSAEEHLACMSQFNRLIAAYRRHMNADGFNIGLNLGRLAGAGLPGHLHWHLVPRWTGDSNFMPVLADTRVISQSLDALWQSLTGGWLSND